MDADIEKLREFLRRKPDSTRWSAVRHIARRRFAGRELGGSGARLTRRLSAA
jgi:hypothetical protein